jgi:molecular chaperone DnaK (HSP70)
MSTKSRDPMRSLQAFGPQGGGGDGMGPYGLIEGRAARQASAGSGRSDSSRNHRKRRRQRPQHPRQGRPSQLDKVSRESMFQDIEGLLRQIRERAEETAQWNEEQLSEFTHAVTGFTRSLEEEGEQISERARSEYQRVRDKLSQALKG